MIEASGLFSFPPGVYVGTLNLIASIPGPSFHTFHRKVVEVSRQWLTYMYNLSRVDCKVIAL